MSTPIHPSRLPNIPLPKKKKRLKPPKPQPASTSLTRAQLRKKIRDLTRLLSSSSSTSSTSKGKKQLPATARVDTERALAAYKLELSSQQQSSKITALQKRYHKVRFFERRKASRLLSRLYKQKQTLSSTTTSTSTPETNHKEENEEEKEAVKEREKDDVKAPKQTQKDKEDDIKTLDEKIHQAEIDLNYIIHYPPLEKYISLYKPGTDTCTNQKREKIRNDIERRMGEGTLEQGEDLVAVNAAEGFGGSTTLTTTTSSSKKKRIAEEDEDDGFFE
ncbi:hypothetical protein AA313_de0203930 [Arthrobotrys entomopaga]|nr:hypothetical protein AA313_de0203930 [Arthrobotrys entomopaga]